MADKNFKIDIGTTGDASGAEKVEKGLKKVDKAAEAAGASSTRLGKTLGGTGSGATGGVAGKLKATSKAASETTNTGRKMGSVMQQAGFQVGDFAVQVGAGQSALTAFAQQGSQMLGAFGAGGALAGAGLAVGAAIARAMGQARDEMEETGEEAERLDEIFEKLGERVADEVAAEMARSYDAFQDSLANNVESVKELNNQIARNIQLMRERRRAELEATSAEAALEMERIDSDPDLSEAEKIRRRAGVESRVTAAKRTAELQALADSTAPAEGAAREARQRETDLRSNLEATRRELDEKQKRVEELRNQVRAAAAIEKRLDDARTRLPELMDRLPGRINEPTLEFFERTGADVGEKGRPELRKNIQEVLRLRGVIRNLSAAPGRMSRKDGKFISPEAARLSELTGGGEGSIEDAASRAKALSDELESAEEQVRRAERAFSEVAGNAEAVRDQLRRRFEAEDRLRNLQGRNEIGGQPVLGPELPPPGADAAGLAGEGIALGDQVGTTLRTGGLSGAQIARVQPAIDALQRGGVQQGEASALSAMLDRVLTVIEGGQGVQSELSQKIRTQQAKLEQLEARQRNMRDN